LGFVAGPLTSQSADLQLAQPKMNRDRETKMPPISPAEFRGLPLRVHALLADVPLHDVWAVDLSAHRGGLTLAEFLGRSRRCGIHKLPTAASAIMGLRLLLGRIFRLEAEPKDAASTSFETRLTPEDRARSLIAPGTREGLFRVVYRFENEQLLEIHNRTVHGAALSALTERVNGYRFFFAVYVRPTSWITPLYMGLIDPFRKWIIYPALLQSIRRTWDQNLGKHSQDSPDAT
jgi:hypothetical protein